MVNDEDARNLINFVDNERVVCIYIDTTKPRANECLESQIGFNPSLFNTLIEDAGYICEEPDDDFETESDRDIDMNDQIFDETYQGHVLDMIELDNGSDDNEETDGEETDGNDSVFSDGFEESDFELADLLFDENIDEEIEWVDIRNESTLDKGKKSIEIQTSQKVRPLSKTKLSKSCKTSQYLIYEDNADDSDFEFEVGLNFITVQQFRNAVRIYSTKQEKPLKFTKNSSDRVQVTCECGWIITASFISKNDKTFQVKSIKNEHTCCRVASSKHCTSKFLAEKYQHYLRNNREWPVNSMQEIMQMENQTELSTWKMYRAKKHATKLSHGTELEQYANLWRYCEEIYMTNPGTTIKIKCKHVIGSQTSTFKRLYICWGALKKGFKEGCRPIIGLDGTHLKTSIGGVLLCAVGIDGKNSMYPIAYAMVPKENTKTWEWFVSLLIDDLDMRNSYAWTIISDKQKGLIKAIGNLLPNAEHRFCLRHMYTNFKQKYKGLVLKDLLWKAALATRVVDFNSHMENLKATDSTAYDWVREKPPVHWAKSHFSTWPKCDLLLNNLCESFNHVILKAREKSIITMLETIRVILMKRIHMQRDRVLKSNGEVCPSVQKLLENNKTGAHGYILEWNGHDKFEAKGCYGDKWIVDLTKKLCSCRKWDLTGVPCVHATACIFYKREKVEDYIEHWYKKDTFLKAYANFLNPLKGKNEWPNCTMVPLVPWSEKPKTVGRKKKHARKMEPNELGKKTGTSKKNDLKYACSICRELGHNKSSCKQRSVQEKAAPNTKKSKLPVKKVGNSEFANDTSSRTTHVQGLSLGTSTSVVATRFYMMNSCKLVTQQSDENSTFTRLYN